MSKKKWVAIVIAIVVVVLFVLMILRRKNAIENTSTGSSASTTSKTSTSSITNWNTVGKDLDGEIAWPIVKGDKGTIVSYIQKGLNDMYNSGLAVDGKFGPKTEEALHLNCGTKKMTEAYFSIFKTLYSRHLKGE